MVDCGTAAAGGAAGMRNDDIPREDARPCSLRCLLRLLALQQGADAFQIAVAAAHDLHAVDGAVVVQFNGGGAAAHAAVCLGIGGHTIVSPFDLRSLRDRASASIRCMVVSGVVQLPIGRGVPAYRP